MDWVIRSIVKKPAIDVPSLWVGNLLSALAFAGAHLPQLTFRGWSLFPELACCRESVHPGRSALWRDGLSRGPLGALIGSAEHPHGRWHRCCSREGDEGGIRTIMENGYMETGGLIQAI